MSHQSLTQWIPRLVVCTIAATVAFLLTDPSGGNRPFAIELEMSSPVDGALLGLVTQLCEFHDFTSTSWSR